MQGFKVVVVVEDVIVVVVEDVIAVVVLVEVETEAEVVSVVVLVEVEAEAVEVGFGFGVGSIDKIFISSLGSFCKIKSRGIDQKFFAAAKAIKR